MSNVEVLEKLEIKKDTYTQKDLIEISLEHSEEGRIRKVEHGKNVSATRANIFLRAINKRKHTYKKKGYQCLFLPPVPVYIISNLDKKNSLLTIPHVK